MSAALAGRGAVVTGGGRGIGAAIARTLAAQGAAVVVAARTAGEIESVAGAIRATGGRAFAVAADVTREDAIATLAEAANAALGHVDVLVHAAGEGASAPFHRLALADWNAMLAVHATGAFLAARAFAPAMRERNWGRIVNVASVAGLDGGKYIAHYSAAKHALIGFTRSIAIELEGSGVTVNAVCPGYVDTPMTERTVANVVARAGLDRAHALRAILATTGQERLLAPDEVARAVLELILGGATGRIVPVGMKAEVS